MKKILFLLVLVCCQFVFPQEEYSKYKPVEPLYNGGGLDSFYGYLSATIDFTKVPIGGNAIIGFVLDEKGKMNHIKVAFADNTDAEKAITAALLKADKWDVSNQKSKPLFICYKIKLYFSENKVKGLAKTMWFKDDVPDIPIAEDEFEQSESVAITPAPKTSDPSNNTIYNSASIEVKPEYPGGMMAFYSFIAKKYKVPRVAGLKGKVIIAFVVEKDGSLADLKILRDIGYGTGEEAIRVLKLCERWKPAMQNGLPVRCSYQLPINIEAK